MDKLMHLLAGIWIAQVGGAVTRRAYVGLIIAIIAGAGKEALDLLGYGTPEVADFLVTTLGGLVGTIVAWFGLRVESRMGGAN